MWDKLYILIDIPEIFVGMQFDEVNMIERQPSIKRKLLVKPYPENLILTLLLGNMDTFDVTTDIQEGLDYALSELTEVEQEVLKLRFQERLTYEKIGALRGRSNHGACAVENNAMRKLRHSSRLGYVLYGKKGFEAMDCVFHFPWEAPPPKKEAPDPKLLLTPFEELDLSIGSFNNLRRAGYEFVGDIVDLTYEQILQIKRLSKKNCMEIAVKLQSIGLEHTAWKDFI